MTHRPDRFRPRHFGLFIPSLLGLSACGSGPTVGTAAYRTYTDAELRAVYTDAPSVTLPIQSSSTLGENYTLSGRATNWNKSKAINLYYSPTSATPPATADGQISTEGNITLTTPLLNLASQETTLREVINVGTYNYGLTCPLDSLTASKEVKVRVLSARFIYSIKDVAALDTQTLKPLLSPVPVYGYVEPNRVAGAGSVVLVWANEAFTVQGEKRCLSGFVQTIAPFAKSLRQDNTLINVKLERGWNVLNQITTSAGSSDEGFDIIQHAWSALPAEALNTWVSNY